MKLDFTQLKVLDSLLRELSLTRTGELLGMTQPTVSRVLARLRRHFGDPLFVRAGQRMQPTARALELAGPIAAVLDGLRQLQGGAAAFDPASSQRCFQLYMVGDSVVRVLPAVLAGMAQAAPMACIRIVQCDPRELERQLEQGGVDLALGAFPQLINNIRQRPLWLERYATVMRSSHPCAGKLDHAAFAAQRHVLVALADAHHEYGAANGILAAMLPASAVLCHVPSFTAAAHVVRHTDAVATLPRRLAQGLADDLGLAVADTPVALPPLPLAMYWHERWHRDPASRWLREVVRARLGRIG